MYLSRDEDGKSEKFFWKFVYNDHSKFYQWSNQDLLKKGDKILKE